MIDINMLACQSPAEKTARSEQHMATRDGKQFVDRLRRFPREVWIEGKLVTDVTAHPALRRSVRQLGRLYDMQQEPGLRDPLTFVVPQTSQPTGTAFIPSP